MISYQNTFRIFETESFMRNYYVDNIAIYLSDLQRFGFESAFFQILLTSYTDSDKAMYHKHLGFFTIITKYFISCVAKACSQIITDSFQMHTNEKSCLHLNKNIFEWWLFT